MMEMGLANYKYGTCADGKQDRQNYRDRFTLKPNCNPDNGGPPYMTVVMLLLAIYFYVTTESLMHSELILSSEAIKADGKVWTYFTYALLHANMGHIVSNSIILVL